jgi:glycosyltransferase involved in cell wall biosynthesis
LNLVLIGPVYPYRAGIAYCTTRLAEELGKSHDVAVVSFKRQYPKRFYPGGDDIDTTLRAKTPPGARFDLDVINPISWIRVGRELQHARPDAVIFVWWIWVWALPYLTILAFLPRTTRVILQCHNIGEKEPSWWKRALTNRVLRRADTLVVHAKTESEEAARRVGGKARIVTTFLPVHELGGEIPSRNAARANLGITAKNVALFFGHIRPFKALDVALRAWAKLQTDDVLLLVAGEAWWKSEEEYRRLAEQLNLDTGHPTPDTRHQGGRAVAFDFRFIPDSEIATYFAAADVVLAPYRIEAQSGVALTAFHFARPVIATTVGGLPEIIEEGKNGYLVPPDDADALAGAIETFFARADRNSMESAAARAASRYSWEEYGRVFSRLVRGE